MKKLTLFLATIFCVGLLSAQTVVFYETFGEAGPTGTPKARIIEYTDYDNGAPVTFTETTTEYADVRATSKINTHIWFPADKTTDLVISNIPTDGYDDLKLSFDIASNYQGGTTNVDKVIVYCNDVELVIPSVSITAANTYANSGNIAIPNAETTKLRFYYTAANNPTGYGYRLDNVKIISGTQTSLTSLTGNTPSFYVSGEKLMTENIEDGTMVEIYNAVGAKVVTSFVIGNSVELNTTLNKGVYIIKAGNRTQKIMF